MAALAAAQDVTIINRCGDQIVMADARRLSQVFNNLLSNAIKFSPPDSDIEILSKEDGNNLVVSIIDKGTGLSKENARHVFEKFFQVDGTRKHQGSGLGLAICKLIIDSHSGEIGVDSSLQKGSRFWFSLPRAQL
jgi:signal transduction histidine kinase